MSTLDPPSPFDPAADSPGWGRRLVALVVAIALVAGAWFVRDRYLDGDTDATQTDGRSDDNGRTDGVPVVACDPATGLCDELAARLDGSSRLTLRVEVPGTTLRHVQANSDVPALWVTADLWVLIAQDSEKAAPLDALSTPIADVSLHGLSATAKRAALLEVCPQTTMGCLGALAGSRWGEPGVAAVADRFDLGLDPPGTTGNLLAVADAVADFAGVERPDIDDFAAVRARVQAMVRAAVPVPSTSTAAEEFATTPAAFDVATTVDGESKVGRDREAPFPVGGFEADVIVAGSRAPDDALDELRDALDDMGIELTAPDRATLAPGSRPNGATLEAMWNEAGDAA